MEFHFTTKLEEYYQKFVDLQEKLKKSEEERFILETKFNDMVQVAKEEEQAHYRKLRSQYKRFLEEDKKRQDRNERIIRNLERIETRISMLSAKTDRINVLRRQYQNFLLRIANPNQERKLPESGINRERSFIKEAPLKEQHGPLFRDDFSLPTKSKETIGLKQPLLEYPKSLKNNIQQSNEEKIEILDRYLQGISTQRCRDLINQDKSRNDNFWKEDSAPSGNDATAIADDIMNSIYSRYYNKGENLDNDIEEQTRTVRERSRNIQGFKSTVGDLNNACDNVILGQQDNKKYENIAKPSSLKFNEKVDIYTEDKPSKSMENQINVNDQSINLLPSSTNEDINIQNKTENIINEAEIVEPKRSSIIIPNDSLNIEPPIIIDPIKLSSKENVIHTTNEYPQAQNEDTKPAEEIYQQPDNEQSQNNESHPIISEVHQQPNPAAADYHQQSQLDQQVENQDIKVHPVVNPKASHQPLSDQSQGEVHDQSQGKTYHDQPEEDIQQLLNYEQSVLLGQIQASNDAQIENSKHQQESPLHNDQAQVPQVPVEVEPSEQNNQQASIQHVENEAPIIDQQNEFIQEYNPQTQFDPNINPTQYMDENGQPLQYDPSYDQQQFDESGQPIHYDPATGYDQYGQPILYNQHGQIVQPQYDENGQIVPQYDENGQLMILYDQSGNVYGQSEDQQYDPNGQPYEQYDQNAVQYDENGQPVYDQSYNYAIDPNQQGYGDDPNKPGYEADPNQQGYEADPNQQGYEAEPNQQGYEADPNQQGYEADPNQQKHDDQYNVVDDQRFATVKDDQIVGESENLENDKDDDQEKHEIMEAKDKNAVEKVAKVMDILDTDTESTKQNTSKISHDTDFDFS